MTKALFGGFLYLEEELTKVQVVDAICGSGKTTWVFEYMKGVEH